jgi:hypothetical protein
MELNLSTVQLLAAGCRLLAIKGKIKRPRRVERRTKSKMNYKQ